MICNTNSDDRTSFLCFQVTFIKRNNQKTFSKNCLVMCFYALQVSLEQFYQTLADNPDKHL